MLCKFCKAYVANIYKICTLCTRTLPHDVFMEHMKLQPAYQPVAKGSTSAYPTPYGKAKPIKAAEEAVMEPTKKGGFHTSSTKEYDDIIKPLINLYGLSGEFYVASGQVGNPRDCIVTLNGNRKLRIDRQGKESGYGTAYARYAVQIDKGIQAGIHMQADKQFDPELIMDAFVASYEKGVYMRVYYKVK